VPVNYVAAIRDIEFALWQQLAIETNLLTQVAYEHLDVVTVNDALKRTRDFALDVLGPLYQSSDREGAELLPDGKIRLPQGFEEAWRLYKDGGWAGLSIPQSEGGLGFPYVVSTAIQEMLYGANPAFMTLSGFCVPLYFLLKKYGRAELQAAICPSLATLDWTACLCMTEPDAGSDVGAIATRARPLNDDRYAITGTKHFISAGSHDLAANIVYVVLARIEGAPTGTAGLSCFLVPRYRIESEESGADNHVRCLRLENKMGMKGCPTAQMGFGEHGESFGYLLGEKPHRGLLQLRSMMNQARITTGVFALGMASSAYLLSASYAAQRVQGTNQRMAFSVSAPRVRIVEHADVRRMLLEMKCTVEGCRALLYKMAYYGSFIPAADAVEHPDSPPWRRRLLIELLTPVLKAYLSDQAWRISELAIQVHGGFGYLIDGLVEQYARDVKVLSIWEGTNYLQAADLLRDKLGFGKRLTQLDVLERQILDELADAMLPEFADLQQQLVTALARLRETLGNEWEWVRKGRVDVVLLHATRVLRMFAHVLLGWVLLEAACTAARARSSCAEGQELITFYEGKLLSVRFFFSHLMPMVELDASVIAHAETSLVDASTDRLIEGMLP
jgi:acyl-CoA dehydrogenase